MFYLFSILLHLYWSSSVLPSWTLIFYFSPYVICVLLSPSQAKPRPHLHHLVSPYSFLISVISPWHHLNPLCFLILCSFLWLIHDATSITSDHFILSLFLWLVHDPHPHHPWSIYIFLVFVVRPHCILTSEDLVLVITDEWEYVAFVFWGLCSMVPETILQAEGKEVIK